MRHDGKSMSKEAVSFEIKFPGEMTIPKVTIPWSRSHSSMHLQASLLQLHVSARPWASCPYRREWHCVCTWIISRRAVKIKSSCDAYLVIYPSMMLSRHSFGVIYIGEDRNCRACRVLSKEGKKPFLCVIQSWLIARAMPPALAYTSGFSDDVYVGLVFEVPAKWLIERLPDARANFISLNFLSSIHPIETQRYREAAAGRGIRAWHKLQPA
ncbi:hypothetical protein F4780DRAFT_627116 [Xylariomycetidae sp. FL0641]|nr:hypothetical protein F4780DRAFT_627116 [Xylariomycetidae sp. FL0641]